jgi:TRAP-type C4-dicarboxylate transport system permease small subunit
MPKPVRTFVDLINYSISFILLALFTWKGIEKALEFIETGENSPNLGFPNYPFAFFMSFGCLVLCLEYLRNIIRVLQTNKESDMR